MKKRKGLKLEIQKVFIYNNCLLTCHLQQYKNVIDQSYRYGVYLLNLGRHRSLNDT